MSSLIENDRSSLELLPPAPAALPVGGGCAFHRLPHQVEPSLSRFRIEPRASTSTLAGSSQAGNTRASPESRGGDGVIDACRCSDLTALTASLVEEIVLRGTDARPDAARFSIVLYPKRARLGSRFDHQTAVAGVMVDYEQGGEPDASATKATVILVTKYPAPNRCTSPAAKPRAAAAAAWEIRRGDQ